MTIERVVRGERPKADHQNEFIGEHNALMRPGASHPAQYGTHGVSFFPTPMETFALFELQKLLFYPNPADGCADPTPYSEDATMLYLVRDSECSSSSSGEVTQPRSYRTSETYETHTLWHPTAFRNAIGVAIGHPTHRVGDRCYAKWSPQSGRWEIVTPPMDVWRFVLKEQLTIDSHAEAYLRVCASRNAEDHEDDDPYVADTSIVFEVWDTIHSFYGAIGKVGKAKYFPDTGRWEIICMECP